MPCQCNFETPSQVSIFKHMEGTWDRLSTLAYFWNASSPEERKIIFGQFLVIMAGDGAPANIDDYELSQMVALPTENYEEASKFPVGWGSWLTAD